MTAVLTETLTADAMVKIAREQVAAFNRSDWERVRAGLAPDVATTSLELSGRSRARRRSSSCSRGGSLRFRMYRHGHECRRQR